MNTSECQEKSLDYIMWQHDENKLSLNFGI